MDDGRWGKDGPRLIPIVHRPSSSSEDGEGMVKRRIRSAGPGVLALVMLAGCSLPGMQPPPPRVPLAPVVRPYRPPAPVPTTPPGLPLTALPSPIPTGGPYLPGSTPQVPSSPTAFETATPIVLQPQST